MSKQLTPGGIVEVAMSHSKRTHVQTRMPDSQVSIPLFGLQRTVIECECGSRFDTYEEWAVHVVGFLFGEEE